MSDAMNLLGRRALVTGATSGIGRAIALKLAAEGAEVVVQGRDEARGRDTVEAILDGGGKAEFVAADLQNADEVRALVERVGSVDVLVNNAGQSVFAPTADIDASVFDAMFASNVRAPFLLVAGFAPGMAERGSGSIVSISSMAARVGLAVGAAYGGTKGALESMTRAWTAEFSPSGVRVNIVAPGPVYTDGSSDDLIAALGATTPFNRGAQPDEIAQVVAFLASPNSSYLTGAIVPVDGGRTAI